MNPITTAENFGKGISCLISDKDKEETKAVAMACLKQGTGILVTSLAGTAVSLLDGDIFGAGLKIAGFDVAENLNKIVAGGSIVLSAVLLAKWFYQKG